MPFNFCSFSVVSPLCSVFETGLHYPVLACGNSLCRDQAGLKLTTICLSMHRLSSGATLAISPHLFFCFVLRGGCLYFQDRVSLRRPGYPITPSEDQAGLKFKISACLCRLRAGTKGMHHHVQLISPVLREGTEKQFGLKFFNFFSPFFSSRKQIAECVIWPAGHAEKMHTPVKNIPHSSTRHISTLLKLIKIRYTFKN